ncbi:MAG: zinc-binding dehydrogenase [Eisenbergiella sp.]
MADIVDQRLELAKTFGIKYTVNPQTEDAPGYIREVTGGRMAECVSEVSGSAAAVRNAWTMPRRQAEWRSPDGPTGR